MQIADVMKLTGLSRKAIYLYEERGLLSPGKVPAGELREYRSYTQGDIKRLRLIAGLRELELSLSDIERVIRGERADIVLQNHLKQQQERLGELLQGMEKAGGLLASLPPNAGCEEIEERLAPLQCGSGAQRPRRELDEVFSEGYIRRVAMLLYEAFLDKPINTKERWAAWYALLDRLESCITPDMLEAYGEFYGRLSTEQLCEDYALRRELVCGYTRYSPQEEAEKAEEIMEELKGLLLDERAFSRWDAFFRRIVRGGRLNQESVEYMRLLSDVYDSYQEHFSRMHREYLEPLLESPEGSLVKALLLKRMGSDMFDHQGLIYFDFYNHTLRRVLYGEAPLK